MGFVLAFLLIWIPCGIYSGVVAEEKGHGGIAWFWGGVIFGPMALISVVGLPDRKLRSYLKALAIKQEALIDEDKRKDANDVAGEILKKKRGY